MKKIFFAIAVVLSLSVHAQKDFEGSIKYRVIGKSPEPDDKKNDNNEIRIYFTPGKILIRQTEGINKDDLLIIFDSAKVYMLDRNEKTYTVKRLRQRKSTPVLAKETILGYSATPISPVGPMASVTGGFNIWYADSLFFHIPPGFEGNEELMMVYNNKIMLKAVMTMTIESYSYNEWGDDAPSDTTRMDDSFSITAVEIKQGGIAPADFVIPNDYSKQNLYSNIDSVTTVADTTIIIDSAVNYKQPPAKFPEKETPPKQPATTTVEKTPARKNDP